MQIFHIIKNWQNKYIFFYYKYSNEKKNKKEKPPVEKAFDKIKMKIRRHKRVL